jgi:hypothetical protein
MTDFDLDAVINDFIFDDDSDLILQPAALQVI